MLAGIKKACVIWCLTRVLSDVFCHSADTPKPDWRERRMKLLNVDKGMKML